MEKSKLKQIFLFFTLCGTILTLFLYLYFYTSGYGILILYVYFSLLAFLVAQAVLIKNMPQQWSISLILLTLFLARVPFLFLNITHEVIITGSDQVYDLSVVRETFNTGVISTDNVINGRYTDYAFYPAIHICSSAMMLVTSLPETVVIIIPPLLETIFLLFLSLIVSKYNIQLSGLFVLLTITIGYGSFHTQFVRETYSSVLQLVLIIFLILSFLNRRKTIIFSVVLLSVISFSHFYLQFTLLAIFACVLVSSKYLKKNDFETTTHKGSFLPFKTQLSVGTATKIGLILFFMYNSFIGLGYIQGLNVQDILAEVFSFFSTISSPATIENFVNIGSQALTFERYLIYIQQLFLIVCICLVSIFLFKDSKVKKKVLVPVFIFLPIYILSLSLRLAQNAYINNLGLRASGVFLLFFAMYVLFICRYTKVSTKKRIFKVVLFLSIVSLITFPAFLSPAYKDNSLSFYVPAQISKELSVNFVSSNTIHGLQSSFDAYSAFDSYLSVHHQASLLSNISDAKPNSVVVVTNIYEQYLEHSVILSTGDFSLVYIKK